MAGAARARLPERLFRGHLRQVHPAPLAPFEVRFETPPGAQAQVDFAQFQVVFTEEPAMGIVWLLGDDFEATAFLDKEACKQVLDETHQRPIVCNN